MASGPWRPYRKVFLFPKWRGGIRVAVLDFQSHARIASLITESTGRTPVLLEALPWPEVAEVRERNGGLLVVPCGATEQHGPHLPIGTDTLLAEACCWYASAVACIPVLPALAITVSQGHTAKWPGTFSLRHETFIATAREIAAWAAATGWKRLLFVNSHFGNDASLRVAVDQIRVEQLGRLLVGTRNTFSLTPEIWDDFVSDAEDLHANCAETALMLHLAPHLVRSTTDADDPDRTGASVFSYPVAQTSLNGVTGFPSQATPAAGADLFLKMGKALAALLERATSDEPPLPAREWTDVVRESLF